MFDAEPYFIFNSRQGKFILGKRLDKYLG